MATLGSMTSHQHLAGAGMDQATQHFERGRLTGTIGAEKAHHFTGSDRKGHPLDRRHLTMATAQKMLQGASETRLLVGDPIGLAQPFNRNQRGIQRSPSALASG